MQKASVAVAVVVCVGLRTTACRDDDEKRETFREYKKFILQAPSQREPVLFDGRSQGSCQYLLTGSMRSYRCVVFWGSTRNILTQSLDVFHCLV